MTRANGGFGDQANAEPDADEAFGDTAADVVTLYFGPICRRGKLRHPPRHLLSDRYGTRLGPSCSARRTCFGTARLCSQ